MGLLSIRYRAFETLEDILTLHDLTEEALKESRFGKAQFSEQKFRTAAEKAANDTKIHGVLAAQFKARPVGFVYCNIGEPLLGEGYLIATVQTIYVSEGIRSSLLGGRIANSLLNGVQSWAKSRGAEEVMLHVTSGIKAKQTHRFLKRRGFETYGGHYSRSLRQDELKD